VKTTFRPVTSTMIIFMSLFLVAETMAMVYRYDSNDVHTDIPDLGTIYSSLTVPDSFTIKDVNLVLDITHTYDIDLDAYLVAPDGTQVELFTDVGGSGNNFENTILDDECPISIKDGSAPFTGCYRPEGNLLDFDGLIAQGIWKLKITDDAGVEYGVLKSWSLIIDYWPITMAPTRPLPPKGTADVPVDTCLTWDCNFAPTGTTWDVYLGTNPNELQPVAFDLTEPNLWVNLDVKTLYYWQVLAKSEYGQSLGPIWSFETSADPNSFSFRFGQIVSGLIGAKGEIDTYTFFAKAEDTVLIRMSVPSVYPYTEPEIRLYGPDGRELASVYMPELSGPAEILYFLPDDGQYTVEACDHGLDETGSYGMFIQRVNNPARDCREVKGPGNATAVDFGQNVSASVSAVGQVDTYTFSARARDTVLIRLSVPSVYPYKEPEIRLYGPYGRELASVYMPERSGPAEILYFLPFDGQYTVLACDHWSDETGDYTLSLEQ